MVNTQGTSTNPNAQKINQHNQASSRDIAIRTQQEQERQAQARQLAQNPNGIQSGGSGKGVIFRGPNRFGESQTQPTVKLDVNKQAQDYAKSLVVNRGLSVPAITNPQEKGYNPNDPFNQAFSAYLTANKLERSANKPENEPSKAVDLFLKPEENYGYSGGVKVSSIISSNFAKNPEETNMILSFEKPATQARASFRSQFSSDQGGIITPQSQGKSFGYSWASKQTQSEAEKLFSGQTQLKRGSTQEQAIQNSEAARALAGTKSTSNKDYLSGGTKQPDYNAVVTLGKAQKVFGKTDTGLYGWTDVSKDQLVRGSAREKQVQEGIASSFLPKSNAPKGKTTSISLSESLGISSSVSPTSSSSGGADLITNYRSIQGLANKGALIAFSDQAGKPLGFAEGKNAGYDYLKISQGGKQPVSYSVFYPKTEKALLSSIQKNPAYFEKQPQSFWDSQFKKGNLQPSDIYTINSIFHAYDREQNAQAKVDQKSFAYSLTRQEKPGIIFEATDKTGKITSTSGQRTRYDILKAEGYGTKGKEVGPYQNVNVTPKERLSLSQAYNYNVGVDLSKIPSSKNYAENVYGMLRGAGLGTLGLLAGMRVEGNLIINSVSNLLPAPYQPTNKTKTDQSIYNLKYLATLGIKPSGIYQPILSSQGNVTKALSDIRIEQKNPPTFTKEDQQLMNATSFPSISGVNLGRQNATENSAYYYGTIIPSAVSVAIGVYGFKGLVPFKSTEVKLPYTEGVKPVSVYSLGYEGKNAVIVGGRSNQGFFRGMPKAENLNLEKLAPTTERYGYESGAGKPVQNKVITNVVVPALEKQGKLSKTGALDILEAGKEGSKLAVKSPTVQFRGFGEKPFVNLSPEETTVLLGFIKSKSLTVTGSTAEIPFTKEGLVAQARDIDIKGVPKEKAIKFAGQIAEDLNKVTEKGRTFKVQGTTIELHTTDAGQIPAKILEFPQGKTTPEGYGLSPTEQSYVFGNLVPTKKTKVEGISTVPYNYQGLRKLASSTEFHIDQPSELFPLGKGEIAVRAATGREVKDPAHLYSFYKTKAENYLTSGKKAKGERLNIIAENYKNRHPELDFSSQFTKSGAGTLELDIGKPSTSVLSSIGSTSISKISSNVEKPASASLIGSPSALSSIRSMSKSPSSISSKGSSLYSISNIQSKGSSSIIPSKTNLSSITGSLLSSTKSPSGASSVKGKSPKSSFIPSSISTSTTPSKSTKSVGSVFGSGGSTSPSFTSTSTSSSTFGNSPGQLLTGKSIISNQPTKLLPIYYGNYGKRRKSKLKSGPTGLLALNVTNIFASDLNIKVSKNKRFLF